MAATIRLHDYPRSSAAYRVRIALGLKRMAHERVRVDLLEGAHRSAAFRAVNRQGLVPALEVDGTVLTQSLAIIEWLDETVPEPPLLPSRPLDRARTRARALLVAADIHPVNNLRVLRRLETQFGAPPADRLAWMAHWMAEGFAALEADAGDGPFLGGSAPDLADVCLVPQLYNARRWNVPLDGYPRLTAIDARCTALEAFEKAHPDQP